MHTNMVTRQILLKNRPFKSCFSTISLFLGLLSTNSKCVMGVFSVVEFTTFFEKIERQPRDNKNILFPTSFCMRKNLSGSGKHCRFKFLSISTL